MKIVPVVQVSLKEGRTLEQRRTLVARTTDVLVDVCGSNRQKVHVIINEIEQDKWGRGGALLSDLKD